MQIRRCAVLFLEPRETVAFDLASLIGGGAPLERALRWYALAPHRDGELQVAEAEREALGRLSPEVWVGAEALGLSEELLQRLLEAGLVISDAPRFAGWKRRDDGLRAMHWHPLAATLHWATRWSRVDALAEAELAPVRSTRELTRRFGPPPPHYHARGEAPARLPLPRLPASGFETLLRQRRTCRNFDPVAALPLSDLAALLQRVFGSQGEQEFAPGAVALKKTSPSGGALHPVEAYLLVQRVEGLAPGVYHYHVGGHALEPLPTPLGLQEAAPGAFATALLAGQVWFADAAVLVVLAARFRRSFWKYRQHPKAYRALLLDAGHLSQTLYLGATELGLGAFVTAAINEGQVEEAFGLQPMEEGPLAICGIGPRAATRVTVELDPAGPD